MPWTPWVKVVETDMVPKTRSQGGLFIPLTGAAAGSEPIGNRIIEVPVDAQHTETLRDPRSPFIAYVPVGAVAKGMAIDLAAHELREFENFSIDAGGDLYLGGLNPDGEPCRIGIRHPRLDEQRRARRIDTRGEPVDKHLPYALRHRLRLVEMRCQGVPVGSEEQALVFFLQPDPVLQRAMKMADMHASRGTHARQHPIGEHGSDGGVCARLLEA